LSFSKKLANHIGAIRYFSGSITCLALPLLQPALEIPLAWGPCGGRRAKISRGRSSTTMRSRRDCYNSQGGRAAVHGARLDRGQAVCLYPI
jgi:hypothetical protein